MFVSIPRRSPSRAGLNLFFMYSQCPKRGQHRAGTRQWNRSFSLSGLPPSGQLLNVEPAVCSRPQTWGTLGLTFQDLSNLGLRCERDRLYQVLLSAFQWGNSVCGLHKITQLLSGVSGRQLFLQCLLKMEWPGQGLLVHALSLPQASSELEAE